KRHVTPGSVRRCRRAGRWAWRCARRRRRLQRMAAKCAGCARLGEALVAAAGGEGGGVVVGGGAGGIASGTEDGVGAVSVVGFAVDATGAAPACPGLTSLSVRSPKARHPSPVPAVSTPLMAAKPKPRIPRGDREPILLSPAPAPDLR